MVNYNVDKFIGIVNKNKEKYKIGDDYLPTVSMLRIENGKLYVALPLVNIDDKVWNKGSNVIPEYWALIDPLNMNISQYLYQLVDIVRIIISSLEKIIQQ